METIVIISVTSFIGLVGLIHIGQSIYKLAKEKQVNIKLKKNLNTLCKKIKLNPKAL